MSKKVPLKEIRLEILKLYSKERMYFRPASNSWVLDDKGVSAQELANDVAYEYDFPVTRILLVLERLAKEAKAESEEQVQGWVRGLEAQSGDDTELRRWMELMEAASSEPQEHEANVHAMKQWMWQVKRAIMRQTVEWQVMPIFWSTEGGTGKSFNISRLIEPLKNYSKNMSVSDLSEKFGDRQLSQTYIVFFDEFHGVDKIGVSLFKALLTGKPFDRRAMYSDSAVFAENRLSCIASTNRVPPHGYEDETGVRRVWSIQTTNKRMVSTSPRGLALDAIDMAAVWSAVSVNDPSPEMTIAPKLHTFMTDRRERYLRTRTSLESFCSDGLVIDKDQALPIRDLKRACRQYCQESGIKHPKGSHEAIGEELKKLGFHVVNHSKLHLVKGVRLRLPDDDQEHLIDPPAKS